MPLGTTPLMHAACEGQVDIMELLVQRGAPVNKLDDECKTALSLAAHCGQEAAVSCLLSLGASDQTMLHALGETSLCGAVAGGQEGVVRIMVANRSNFVAVGGQLILARAIVMAATKDRARILHVLLNAEGEEKQRFWARAVTGRYAGDRAKLSALEVASIEGISGLHMAVSYGALRSTRLLLAAGADEMTLDPAGSRASEVIGFAMPSGVEDTNKKCAAVARALKRSPAFRSRSWTWPARLVRDEEDGGGDRVSGYGAAVLPSSDPNSRGAPLGVRVFRPRLSTSWCVRLFPRCG